MISKAEKLPDDVSKLKAIVAHKETHIAKRLILPFLVVVSLCLSPDCLGLVMKSSKLLTHSSKRQASNPFSIFWMSILIRLSRNRKLRPSRSRLMPAGNEVVNRFPTIFLVKRLSMISRKRKKPVLAAVSLPASVKRDLNSCRLNRPNLK